MPDVFTWCATTNSSGESAGSVRRAQFGDGYSQSSANGINPNLRSWSLGFTGDEARTLEIIDFLDSHVGKSFVWDSPLYGEKLFYCDTYAINPNGNGVWTLTATFEQTYQPTESEQPVPLYLDGSVYLDGDQLLDGFKR